MKVNLVQMKSKLFDKGFNLEKIISYIDRAIKTETHLIIFPELSLSGYPCGREFHNLAEPIPGPSTKIIMERIKGKEIHVIFGMPEMARDYLYNSAPIIGPEGIVDVCRKNYLANFISVTTGIKYDEGAYFCPGSEIIVFDTQYGKIGVGICLDLYYPTINRTQALEGAFTFVNISAGPLGSSKINQLFVKVRAIENIGWFLYVNTVEEQGEIIFDGGSCIVDSAGNIKISASQGKEAVEETLEYLLDSESVYRRRREFPLLKIERPEMLQKTVSVSRRIFFGTGG